MPGAWAAKHPNASSAARVAPNNISTTTRRPLAAAPTRPAANVANAQRAPVNNSTIRRPLAAPAHYANANANTRAPAQQAAVKNTKNSRQLAAPAKNATAINRSLAQRVAAAPKPHPVPTHKPLPGVWRTPEKRSPLSQKLLTKIDVTRKTLAQKGGEPIAPKEEPKYINTTVKQSSPISRYLAPKIEATRLPLVDRAALPYSVPQPKQAPSAKSTLPVWRPKTIQKSGATNPERKDPIRETDDVNERGEASDSGEDERGRRTERTAINRREPSTDSYISDDGIAFIDYPDPDPFLYHYDFEEGLFGTLFAQDSDRPVDYPATDLFDFDYSTWSGEGLFGILFEQEEHSPCGGREIRTDGAQSIISYISASEFQETVGGFDSLNEGKSSENLEQPASSEEQLDQLKEENTSEGPEELRTATISSSIGSEFNGLVSFDHLEEENTSNSPEEVASVQGQRTGRAESVYSYISESEFQEIVSGVVLPNEENTLEGAEELATHEKQRVEVEHQSTDATYQATIEQLEVAYCGQIAQLEQVIQEVEKSELRLQAALHKKAEINRQVTETIQKIEKQLVEQNLIEEEARKLVERSYARLCRATNERAAIEIERKVEESYSRLLAAVTAQSVEYQKIVESFETVGKPEDTANHNKGKRRESSDPIEDPIESSHEQFEELQFEELRNVLGIIPTPSPEPGTSEDSGGSPKSSSEEHSGYTTRPTSAGSVCSVSSDRCISSIVLTAEELERILNRPEVKHTARDRDYRLALTRASAIPEHHNFAAASPRAEGVDGEDLIDGDQESGEESETF